MSASSNNRHRFAVAVSLAVSLGILFFLFAKLDWPEVWRQMQQINLWYLPLLLAGFFMMLIMRAFRWRLLLPNGRNLALRDLLDATILGFFASTVLPLRAGELIRPWVLSRWQPVSFSASLASILVERLSDAVCLLAMLLLCLNQMEEIPPLVLVAGQALGFITGVLILIVILSYALPAQMERLFHSICQRTVGMFAPRMAEKANAMISEYFIGVRVISTAGQLLQVAAWSLGLWLLFSLWFQVMLWAFGAYPSLWVGAVLNVMIALAVAAPSAPGFVGTFQAGCIIALSTIYGFSKEFAMAYSVIAHVLQMTMMVAAGLYVLNRRGLTIRQIRQIN